MPVGECNASESNVGALNRSFFLGFGQLRCERPHWQHSVAEATCGTSSSAVLRPADQLVFEMCLLRVPDTSLSNSLYSPSQRHLMRTTDLITVQLESCPPGGTKYISFELSALPFLLAFGVHRPAD